MDIEDRPIISDVIYHVKCYIHLNTHTDYDRYAVVANLWCYKGADVFAGRNLQGCKRA
jgi:hypothetical protein